MKQISLILIPLLVLALTTGCKKTTGCEGGLRADIRFEIPVNIYPAKDTFSIGDTIWIEQSFSDNLQDKNNTKNTYSINNIDLYSNLGITNLNTSFPAISYDDPYLITYTGQTTDNNVGSVKYQVLYIGYTYEANTYKYKAAFIVEKTGFYLIKFFSYADGDDMNLTNCTNEKVTIDYTTNREDNNNYNMLQYAVDDYYSSWTIEEFNKNGGYCFHVK